MGLPLEKALERLCNGGGAAGRGTGTDHSALRGVALPCISQHNPCINTRYQDRKNSAAGFNGNQPEEGEVVCYVGCAKTPRFMVR